MFANLLVNGIIRANAQSRFGPGRQCGRSPVDISSGGMVPINFRWGIGPKDLKATHRSDAIHAKNSQIMGVFCLSKRRNILKIYYNKVYSNISKTI